MVFSNLKKPAFTLIELLVVMTIIGVLAGLIVPNYMLARQRARDAQRKSDLEQIQKALELYKMDQNPVAYPAALALNGEDSDCGKCLSTSGPNLSCPDDEEVYMKEIPCDPQNNDPYIYVYQREVDDSLKYTLTACLENKSDPDGKVFIADCLNLGIEKTEP
ncbi:MAG: prepilin-type N-terminal cleavage/methylation domain-containing protein [Candidatus Shapirobacteria bacterium]|nr:prepilin-type N-terminal cleavage/methylation domain-containing protein [Candidatus Shapirobacteria bacterium]